MKKDSVDTIENVGKTCQKRGYSIEYFKCTKYGIMTLLRSVYLKIINLILKLQKKTITKIKTNESRSVVIASKYNSMRGNWLMFLYQLCQTILKHAVSIQSKQKTLVGTKQLKLWSKTREIMSSIFSHFLLSCYIGNNSKSDNFPPLIKLSVCFTASSSKYGKSRHLSTFCLINIGCLILQMF